MTRKSALIHPQQGMTLLGFIFAVVVLAMLAVLAMKVVPSVMEYASIRKAIVQAKKEGFSEREIQEAFERQRVAGYIDSVNAKDLDIVKTGDGFEVSVAYQKKIALFGPASLVIDYEASTGGASAARKID